MDDFFRFSQKIGFLGILGTPYHGIGATILIGWDMLCLTYAGFLEKVHLPHLSHVTCHMSHVTFHRFLLLSGKVIWLMVCYQRGLPRLVYL